MLGTCWRKNAGVKLCDLFLKLNGLKETLGSYPSKILPFDFSEILNILEITARSKFQLIVECDVIKFLQHKPKE